MPLPTLAQPRRIRLERPGCREDFPFDARTLVFKVGGRMFGLCDIHDRPLRVNLKCEPDLAELLRAQPPAVTPGYHMNKRRRNTLTLDGSLEDALVHERIDRSYDLVLAKLPRSVRSTIGTGRSS